MNTLNRNGPYDKKAVSLKSLVFGNKKTKHTETTLLRLAADASGLLVHSMLLKTSNYTQIQVFSEIEKKLVKSDRRKRV